jgi:hypothetical protein
LSFELCLSSSIQKNATFQKVGLLSSSDKWLETPTPLGPLVRANLNHWLALSVGVNRVSPTPQLRVKTDLYLERYIHLCFLKYLTTDRVVSLKVSH